MDEATKEPPRRRPWVIAVIVIVAVGVGYYLYAYGYINAWTSFAPQSVPLDLGEPPVDAE